MLHVITLFTVPDDEEKFVRSLCKNGDWHILARRIAPELVATDLLRHRLSPLYICHDFWTTPEGYFLGLRSHALQNLFLARRQMAATCFELGAFEFPALADCMTVLAA
jgi:hypothetical protein